MREKGEIRDIMRKIQQNIELHGDRGLRSGYVAIAIVLGVTHMYSVLTIKQSYEPMKLNRKVGVKIVGMLWNDRLTVEFSFRSCISPKQQAFDDIWKNSPAVWPKNVLLICIIR